MDERKSEDVEDLKNEMRKAVEAAGSESRRVFEVYHRALAAGIKLTCEVVIGEEVPEGAKKKEAAPAAFPSQVAFVRRGRIVRGTFNGKDDRDYLKEMEIKL
jgi:hypothetical protein